MDECRIEISNGFLCCPAYPEDCFYVRLTDKYGNELVYWDMTEWQEEPGFVMGAIMGAIRQLVDGDMSRF